MTVMQIYHLEMIKEDIFVEIYYVLMNFFFELFVRQEKVNQIQEIYFLMILCPYMTYLMMDSPNDMDIQTFFRTIFNKINHN